MLNISSFLWANSSITAVVSTGNSWYRCCKARPVSRSLFVIDIRVFKIHFSSLWERSEVHVVASFVHWIFSWIWMFWNMQETSCTAVNAVEGQVCWLHMFSFWIHVVLHECSSRWILPEESKSSLYIWAECLTVSLATSGSMVKTLLVSDAGPKELIVHSNKAEINLCGDVVQKGKGEGPSIILS